MGDGMALQAQITAVSVAGGGCVDIPAATRIVLETPLALQPNVWLRGAGPSSVLAAAPGFSYAALVDTGSQPAGVVGVSDLAIDGSAMTETDSGIGVFLQRVAPGSFVERVLVTRTMRSGIILGSVEGVSIGVRIQGCTFQACGRAFAQFGRTDPDFMGLGVVNAIDVIVADNLFQRCPLAIDCEQHPGVPDYLMNLLIHHNVIRTDIGYLACWGIAVQGQPGRPAKCVSVTGNLFFGGYLTGPAILRQHVEFWHESANHVCLPGLRG